MFYHLLHYIIVQDDFLVKSEPASKKVGTLAIPRMMSHSRGMIGIVWKIGCSGG